MIRLPILMFLASVATVGGVLAQATACPGRPVESILRRADSLQLSPGFAVAVVCGDSIAYVRGFGTADLATGRVVTGDTPFYIASTSKALTALAIARLAMEGKLDLDAPLSRYLPSLKLKPPLSADSITLRSMLSMTWGVADGPVDFRMSYTGEGSRAELLKLLETHGARETGHAFAYSNLPYQILGLMLEEKFGQSWKDIVGETVLQPIGMRNTTARRAPGDTGVIAMPHQATAEGFRRIHLGKEDGNLHPAGGHFSSARDLARLLVVELNDGKIGGRQVEPAAAIQESQRRQSTQDRMASVIHRHAWGLGWDIGTLYGDTILHRPGGFAGYQSHISFMPRRRMGVVVLANGGSMSSALVDLLLGGIYDPVLGSAAGAARLDSTMTAAAFQAAQERRRIAADLARRAARQQPLPHPLESYAGTYVNPESGRVVWSVEGGSLVVRMGAALGEAEVYDATANRFRVEIAGSGTVAGFRFETGTGRAAAVSMLGTEFVRVGP
ncbi:MAG TPA: serine hydrolase [Gemmatimonadales bacterium]|nr:serine hydrolase [Gemmatimonadales bacterium]